MNIIYFDCCSGISGDMILAALIDAGADLDNITYELKKIDLDGYKIYGKDVNRNGIRAYKIEIDCIDNVTKRDFANIRNLIKTSGLSEYVKEKALAVFSDLAAVEAGIHGYDSIDNVHFHELSGIDSIVDIIGAFIAIEELAPDKIITSKIHLGRGNVRCAHGVLPVPVPAVLELLKGFKVYSGGIETELTTPTGAAILKNICDSAADMPEMVLERTGYGAGSKEIKEIPNVLRVMVGTGNTCDINDRVVLIETNIDDMNPEIFGFVAEKLERAGSLEVFTTPVYMKKNRPGTLLSVVSEPEIAEDMVDIILSETTSLGVRYTYISRKKLERKIMEVDTVYGKVRVKLGIRDEKFSNIAPEYESCRSAALEKGAPVKDVYNAAIQSAGILKDLADLKNKEKVY